MECDAGGAAAAVAEQVSALAAGDLLGEVGRVGGAEGLLGDVLERETAGDAVSKLDRRDERVCGGKQGLGVRA